MIPDFIRAISKGQQVAIRNPHAIRPWQHVMEPLNGYLTLVSKLCMEGPAYSGAWNFGSEDSDAKTVEWIIKRICQLWGDNASYSIDDCPQLHEANYLKLDCSKAHQKLHWFGLLDIENTIRMTIRWYRSYYDQSVDIYDLCLNQIEQYISIALEKQMKWLPSLAITT